MALTGDKECENKFYFIAFEIEKMNINFNH